MERRNFLLGSTAAGATLLFGTGAFSAAGVGHGVSIETGDGYLHVEPNPDYEGNVDAYVDESDGPLELTIDDLAEHGWVRFDDLLLVTNTGTQPVGVYVEDQDWLGDDTDTVLDYRLEDHSIVGEDNAVELDGVGGEDNSVTVTIRADSTDHDDFEDVLPGADEESHTVTFVAEAEEDRSLELLEVDADDIVTVGSGNTFDVTVTVTDDGHGGGEATVTLDIEGDQLDPHEETITVPEDGNAEATFEVQTVYNDLEEDNTEFGRHGDFRFDGTDWTVAVDYAGESEEVDGTLEVEDAAIEWYDPDVEKRCPVCNMMTERFHGWHAQVTHADGTRTEFCTTGCVVTYVVDHQQYDGFVMDLPEAEIEGVWVVDFTERPTESGTELIDAHDAYFVLDYETNSKFGTPMSGSPPAFATRGDAEAYVNGELDELEDVDMSNVTEDDIVTIDEFNDQIANEYRPILHNES